MLREKNAREREKKRAQNTNSMWNNKGFEALADPTHQPIKSGAYNHRGRSERESRRKRQEEELEKRKSRNVKEKAARWEPGKGDNVKEPQPVAAPQASLRARVESKVSSQAKRRDPKRAKSKRKRPPADSSSSSSWSDSNERRRSRSLRHSRSSSSSNDDDLDSFGRRIPISSEPSDPDVLHAKPEVELPKTTPNDEQDFVEAVPEAPAPATAADDAPLELPNRKNRKKPRTAYSSDSSEADG